MLAPGCIQKALRILRLDDVNHINDACADLLPRLPLGSVIAVQENDRPPAQGEMP